MEKKPLVIGNWKMELSHKAEIELIRSLKDLLKGSKIKGEVVVCPSFTTLPTMKQELAKTKKIGLGAQNVFWQEKGAYTGQVSINHIKPFVSWCIVGHSEVRAVMGISEEAVMSTAKLLLSHQIRPVICIGETAEERASEKTIEKVRGQVDALLAVFDRAALTNIVLAYEPIWAIGTGVLPEPDEVAQVVLLIRKHIAARYDQELAERVVILYGGSVKPELAAQYVSGPLADGVLVGGASIHPKQFIDIITNVEHVFTKL